MEVAQTAREYNFGQRTTVCGRINEGVEQDIGDQKQDINGIPLSDRWTNKES